MSLGDRLKRAIRARRRRTSELKREERALRRALAFRRTRTAVWRRRFRTTGSDEALEKLRASLSLQRRLLQNTEEKHRQALASGKKLRVWRAKLALLRRRLAERASDRLWGGSRAITNQVIRIVGGRAPITSRKRGACFGNCGSDHHFSQVLADAVDFGIANAQALMDEIACRLGGPCDVRDFQFFTITFRGRIYRVQIIAVTHGTGPHLHVGVRRIA